MSDTHLLDYSFRVRVPAQDGYAVDYQSGLLARYGELCREILPQSASRVVVLTDDRVQRLYGDALAASLRSADLDPAFLTIPAGEKSKNLATFEQLLSELARLKMDRRGLLVNFGGGVVTDLGGFVAASYMRGIAYANFATTLIGQLDASVGGKVAVNSPHAKNLIGAFHHPLHVAGDAQLLRTLSQQDFRSGIAEAIKVAIITSRELFEDIESHRDALRAHDLESLTRVVGTAAHLKMGLIELDPYENDLRRPLNFGHTLGHPIETEFAYQRIRHGEAVAVGMAVATVIARDKGILDPVVAERIFALLETYDLMGCAPRISAEAIIGHLRYIKLIRGNRMHFVLPERIGGVAITEEVSNEELLTGFAEYEAICDARGLWRDS